jgi:DNA-binding response OmpR family regulator
MPGMNGIQLLRKLRERWRMPVIMLTAAPSPLDQRTAMELGAEAYLVKPVHPDDLTRIIGEALRQARWFTIPSRLTSYRSRGLHGPPLL